MWVKQVAIAGGTITGEGTQKEWCHFPGPFKVPEYKWPGLNEGWLL